VYVIWVQGSEVQRFRVQGSEVQRFRVQGSKVQRFRVQGSRLIASRSFFGFFGFPWFPEDIRTFIFLQFVLGGNREPYNLRPCVQFSYNSLRIKDLQGI
jgi:hypothetical protein